MSKLPYTQVTPRSSCAGTAGGGGGISAVIYLPPSLYAQGCGRQRRGSPRRRHGGAHPSRSADTAGPQAACKAGSQCSEWHLLSAVWEVSPPPERPPP